MKVAIIGDGAMGTACAILLATKAELQPLVWSPFEEQAERMANERQNAKYLPGVRLPDRVQVTAEPQRLKEADLYVVAIPTIYLRATLRRLSGSVAAGVPALSVVKGMEREQFRRPSEIIVEELGERPVAVLSGPSHAEEIARHMPASVVVAADEAELARLVQRLFSTPRFRVYTNPDKLGVELAGALKNIVGIAAGVCDGLQLGDNAKAALMTRGLAEITRFSVAQGAQAATFAGLAGVGDMITTCFSPYGRNRRVGELLGRGLKIDQILAGMDAVAEGVWTCQAVCQMARAKGIDMPICNAVYEVIYEGKRPMEALDELMSRELKSEY